MSLRIGSGMDFHQLVEGRELWIGGVNIPNDKGALGHSDADVLLHSICDALLGAVGLGDIGKHFPDTDPAYKDIDSKLLLKKTMKMVKKENYSVVNVDATVLLQSPKISPYVDEMKKVIAEVLDIKSKDVSIKATTTEKMGFIGKGEGVAAYAVVMVK